MDWIGDKLAKLIEEGKRALGKEVVVMSDAKEDEVDDGDAGWQEEDDLNMPGPSTGSHRSRSRPASLAAARMSPSLSHFGHVPETSPRTKRFRANGNGTPGSFTNGGGWPTSVPNTPPNFARGASMESDQNTPLDTNTMEASNEWQSPEIRESMEKARAAFLHRRGTWGATFPG